MKFSWKIGEFAGIGVYVHATFWLLIAWVGFAQWSQSGDIAATLLAVAFILAVFATVVLHEFGHALAAKRYGIATRDITLLPIGGVARLERMPDDPREELVVALAGPAVNVVIAMALYFGFALTGSFAAATEFSLIDGPFFERLMWVNLFLVIFNMLPAFPMDGGRVLRAVLAMRMDYLRATQAAAGIGQAMALLFAFVGLMWNPFLLFIALFVWMGAQQEASLVGMKSALGGIPVSYAMATRYRTLAPHDTVTHAANEIVSGFQHDFPVVNGDEIVGVLEKNDMLVALAQGRQDAPISNIMKKQFEVADTREMLEVAFRRLQGCECQAMPVLRDDTLVGLLSMENVGTFMRVQSALDQGRRGLRGAFDAPLLESSR